MSDAADVIVEQRDTVRLLLLNRPQRRNALRPQTMRQLRAELAAAEAAPDTRAVVLSGAGEHFSAGGDADAIGVVGEQPDVFEAVDFLHVYQEALLAIWDSPLPVVAAVRGSAYGGGMNLALACDLIVADASARFCEVFLRREVVPDMGGAYLLPRLVGRLRAAELILRTRPVEATEATELGLVTELTDGDVLARAVEIAREATAAGPGPVALTKRMLHAAETGTLRDALDLEAVTQSLALHSAPARSGFAEFRHRS